MHLLHLLRVGGSNGGTCRVFCCKWTYYGAMRFAAMVPASLCPPACLPSCRTGTAVPDGTLLAAVLPAGITPLTKTLVVDLVDAFTTYFSWQPNYVVGGGLVGRSNRWVMVEVVGGGSEGGGWVRSPSISSPPSPSASRPHVTLHTQSLMHCFTEVPS